MQNNMPSPANGGRNTSSKRKRSPAKQQKWTLLNLLSTWFLTDEGRAVIVDSTAPGGATDDEWRGLIARTRVRVDSTQLAKPWGQMARRDFLNWCEEHLSVDRRPALFSSKEEALATQDFANLFDGVFDSFPSTSKSLEIVKSQKPAPQDDGDDPPPNSAA